MKITVIGSGNIGSLLGGLLTDAGEDVTLVSVPTLEQATRLAIDRVVPGDTVLFSPACASQDRFQDFEQRGNFFKSLISEWVTERKS